MTLEELQIQGAQHLLDRLGEGYTLYVDPYGLGRIKISAHAPDPRAGYYATGREAVQASNAIMKDFGVRTWR